MGRGRIGRGHEHNVYQDPNDSNIVVKKPRFFQKLITDFDDVQNELSFLRTAVDNTGIVVPETIITPTPSNIPFKSSYEIHQEYIGNDGSCLDLETQIQLKEVRSKLARYSGMAKNYGCRDETIYILDTTIGRGPRVAEKLKFTPAEKYKSFRERISFKSIWQSITRKKTQI